jgi:hypothetical protein
MHEDSMLSVALTHRMKKHLSCYHCWTPFQNREILLLFLCFGYQQLLISDHCLLCCFPLIFGNWISFNLSMKKGTSHCCDSSL